jgi:hypothetical protein
MKVSLIAADSSVAGSFGPLLGSRTDCMIQALEELGHQVQIIPEEKIVNDLDRTRRTISRFNPDFITAVNFNHYLQAARQDEEILRLDVPTVALWDDPLGALANFALRFLSDDLPQPRSDRWTRLQESFQGLKERLFGFPPVDPRADLRAPGAFRALLSNPYWLHFAWDSGHAEAFVALGLARPEQVSWHPVATYAPFLDMGDRAHQVQQTVKVGFCGNLYLAALQSNRFWTDPFYRNMCERIAERKFQEPGVVGWDLLLEELAAARPSLRRRHGLYPDMKRFWEFYVFVLWSVLTTVPRLRLLESVQQKVILFGLFADRATRKAVMARPHLRFGGNLDHFEELPEQFAATAVNLCIANGLIYRGTPSKLIDCLASGGFALSEPKADLVRLFGSKVESIFFHSPEELRDKVSYFLDRPSQRREIVDALRADIKEHCTLRSLFTHVTRTVRSFQPELHQAS